MPGRCGDCKAVCSAAGGRGALSLGSNRGAPHPRRRSLDRSRAAGRWNRHAQSDHRRPRAQSRPGRGFQLSAPDATAVIFDEPAVASIDVRGGGPGTRETALLDPAQTVQGIDAIVLSGGSAFGLDAASGVQAWLREQGRGFAVRSAKVPIVPAAILFDLLSGGDKNWGRFPPYRDLGYAAAVAAGSDSRLAAPAPAPAPPRSIARAASGRPRRKCPTALSSARSPR